MTNAAGLARLGRLAIPLSVIVAAVLVVAFSYGFVSRDSQSRAPDFTLPDQHGRQFTLSAQRGHPLVLFFGYTHCPDACPLTLAHLAHALRATKRADVQVVFISVDPRRDSIAVLKRYLALFDPHFIGLETTRTNLIPIERAYHTWSQELPPDHGNAGDYPVAHGSTTYFIDRAGDIRGFGNWSDSIQTVEHDVTTFLQ